MHSATLLSALAVWTALAATSAGWSAEIGIDPAPEPKGAPQSDVICPTEWCCVIDRVLTCERYVNPLPGTNPVATITDPLLGQPDLEERMRRLFNASPEVQG